MKVLIVAKTRQGSGACVGGITFAGQSVRLIAADATANKHAGMDYSVGEVWEVETRPPQSLVPPHVENVLVFGKRRLGPMTDPVPFIEKHMPSSHGGIDALYDGLAQANATGALYIAQSTGIPPYSTLFWRPDRPLRRDDSAKHVRYRYPTPDGGRTLTFVGFQEPVETIPAGTLLRVSLAHWWRPPEDNEGELRCYVQLSGWFMQAEPLSEEEPGPLQAGREMPRREVSPAEQPTMAAAQDLLKSVFGYDSFRPMQAEIIANLLAKQDTLAVMPTGSGKSLCFQLPALLFEGLTVVVSPLIALMQDQVDQLRELGLPAAFLNSTLDYRAYLKTAGRVRRGEVKLLYTSPETLVRPETLVLLDRCRVDCLAIDEAHCISSWGHDFRPEYRQLRPVRLRYPDAVCVAFTATATPRVQRDIGETLGFRAENAFIASFNRENLFLSVQPRLTGLAQVLSFLEAHRGQSGIIYCATRRGVDRLAAGLAEKGWAVLPYHAGLDDDTRRRHQMLFSRDRVPIIVATIAFGMGINKSNVRFVLHYNLPGNLENYYQEIGRAGRDGLRADCLLLFSRTDLQTHNRFIEEGAASERPGRQARLQAMARYAEARGCRRALLLEYFGESPAPTCAFCDNCLADDIDTARVEVTAAARSLLACARLTGQVFGARHLIGILRGSRSQDILRRHHDGLPQYGTGKDQSAAQWRYLVEQLIIQGILEQDMEYGGLRLTTSGNEILAGDKKVFIVPQRRDPALPADLDAHDPALFERLRVLRRELADANNVPPYVIFSDRSLVEMSASFPQSEAAFLGVHGVGSRKLEQYGPAFLTAIRAYCAEHGLQERSRHP